MGIKGTKEIDNFVLFYGFLSPFSNFYQGTDSEFTYKNNKFNCSEQAYVWEKANFAGNFEIADQILEVSEPSRMKHLGYKIGDLDVNAWNDAKYEIMVAILREKYKTPTLNYKLEKTKSKIIVESSTDKYWGSGFYMNNDYATVIEKWKGQNLLGKAIMQVRSEMFD